ncbi:MAG: Wzz/FepE/Etk N-terminal domain-containing protein [Cetobacterium sp.]|nr:Wzz/FepE/Etk N-terminal domain-containing protein [Cetobacterium sp.]
MKKRREEFYEDDFYEDEDELDLVDLLFTLSRRWKLILLTMVPIFIGGIFFAFTRPTIYQSETTLMVSSGRNYSVASIDGSELSTNQRLVTTYTEVAKSKFLMKRILEKYDLDGTVEGLSGSITVSPISDTELIKITYKNEDPEMAAAVTNEIGSEFIKRIREIMNFQNLKIVENAEVSKTPLPKRRGMILMASLMLGTCVGVGLAFMVEFFHSKLRKPKDIENILKCPMLGMVPEFGLGLKEEEGEKE